MRFKARVLSAGTPYYDKNVSGIGHSAKVEGTVSRTLFASR